MSKLKTRSIHINIFSKEDKMLKVITEELQEEQHRRRIHSSDVFNHLIRKEFALRHPEGLEE